MLPVVGLKVTSVTRNGSQREQAMLPVVDLQGVTSSQSQRVLRAVRGKGLLESEG